MSDKKIGYNPYNPNGGYMADNSKKITTKKYDLLKYCTGETFYGHYSRGIFTVEGELRGKNTRISLSYLYPYQNQYTVEITQGMLVLKFLEINNKWTEENREYDV